jgi:hypothetical protein
VDHVAFPFVFPLAVSSPSAERRGAAANSFKYIRSVPYSVVARLLDYLNLVGEHQAVPSLHRDDASVERIYRSHLLQSYLEHEASLSFMSDDDRKVVENLTWGYVTHDKCPGKGDDTLHKPLPQAWQPTFVSTSLPPAPAKGQETFVDVVFLDCPSPSRLHIIVGS